VPWRSRQSKSTGARAVALHLIFDCIKLKLISEHRYVKDLFTSDDMYHNNSYTKYYTICLQA